MKGRTQDTDPTRSTMLTKSASAPLLDIRDELIGRMEHDERKTRRNSRVAVPWHKVAQSAMHHVGLLLRSYLPSCARVHTAHACARDDPTLLGGRALDGSADHAAAAVEGISAIA